MTSTENNGRVRHVSKEIRGHGDQAGCLTGILQYDKRSGQR